MRDRTDLLIVGAGPFGLAQAAWSRHAGIDFVQVGEPMSFWRHHMPSGMYLRSASDWHLDPGNQWTIEAFLKDRASSPSRFEPISLTGYLEYTNWLAQQARLQSIQRRLISILPDNGFTGRFDDGSEIRAKAVVMALGFQWFPLIPTGLIESIPPQFLHHTLDFVDFSEARDRRFLILGGRQSAFEWAPLLAESGAASVDLIHRHDSPAFMEADWSWVSPIVDGMIDDPGWYRRLGQEAKQEVDHRLWAEGRLKVEPWLEPRFRNQPIRVHPNTWIDSARPLTDGLEVSLTDGSTLVVDQVIAATGYKPSIANVPLLSPMLEIGLEQTDGFANLDEAFQTSIPNLYLTSMLAVRDFGPFFAFTVSARTSASVIGRHLQSTIG